MAKKQVEKSTTINITGMPYTIRLVPYLLTENGELDGVIDIPRRTILVSNNDAYDFEETMIHEIAHVIEDSLSIKMGETKIRAFSRALYDTFKRNPNIKFSMKKLRGELGNGE